MNSLYRRLLQTSPKSRLLAPLSHYATKAKPKPKPPNVANSDFTSDASPSPPPRPPPPCAWSHFSPKPAEPAKAEWARPSEIPFQAKVANSVHLIGYVRAPVQFQTAADGSSWAATVLTHELASDSASASDGGTESPESLPLWVPIIFEGDLAHIAASHLKEHDCVYIAGQLSASLPHVNGSQVQASVQVVAHDISFVENDFKKKKSSNVFIQSERETPNRSDSLSKQADSVSDPWKDLLHNPKEWWDNRAAKLTGSVSRKYPDFKRKDGSSVLWLYRAPKSILSKLEGLEFDALIQRSKVVKESKDSWDSGSDIWTDLVDNPKEWCDYRSSKLQGLVNPKFPDFKRKDGSNALWLDRAPQWLLPKLEGLEFHVQIQKSKTVKDGGKVDELWKDLVENPEKWWDNRLDKIKERAPDFKHKETGEALWLSSSPTWVSLKLPPPKSKGDVAKEKRETLLS